MCVCSVAVCICACVWPIAPADFSVSVQLVGIRLALNSGKHPLFASAVQNLAERYVDHREVRKMLCITVRCCLAGHMRV